MNVGIGTVAVQFLFWEYLFRIFGIVSLQCGQSHSKWIFLTPWGDFTELLQFRITNKRSHICLAYSLL